MNTFITKVLPIISIVISISTFIYNWYTGRKNIKITINNKENIFSNENSEYYLMFLQLNIKNKSKNPITINSINLEIETGITLEALPIEIPIAGDSIFINENEYIYNKRTFKIPYRLEAYDGIDGPLCFSLGLNHNIETNTLTKAKLIVNTSRGKKSKKVLIVVKE